MLSLLVLANVSLEIVWRSPLHALLQWKLAAGTFTCHKSFTDFMQPHKNTEKVDTECQRGLLF